MSIYFDRILIPKHLLLVTTVSTFILDVLQQISRPVNGILNLIKVNASIKEYLFTLFEFNLIKLPSVEIIIKYLQHVHIIECIH